MFRRCADEQSGVLILSLGRMNKIRNIDLMGNTMTVDAGAILSDVKVAAEAADHYFPLTHGGEGSSQIGGNISTNSGGSNALHHTRKHAREAKPKMGAENSLINTDTLANVVYFKERLVSDTE